MNARRILAAIALLAMLAVGCATDETAAPTQLPFADETTITVWAWPGFGYENLIEEFETLNPNITVEVRESGYDQHHEGLLSALDADGELPDVAAIDTAYIADFWGSGDGFTDLDASFDAGERQSLYLDWRWEQGVTPDGTVIGIPTDVGGLGLAYRKDLFAAAGLPSEPAELAPLIETWDDLIALGQQFADSGQQAAFLDSPSSVFNARFSQLPGAYLDEDGVVDLSSDGAVAVAWDQTIEAIDAGVTGGLSQFSPEWNEAIADGGFAAIAAPSWMRGYLASNAPDNAGDWGLVPLPEVAGNWGGSQLVIPASAAHPEAAWELIEFLTTEEAQFEVFTDFGNFPSTPSAYSSAEIDGLTDAYFDGQVVGPIFVDSVERVPVKPLNVGQRAMNNEIISSLLQYDVGEWTIEDEFTEDGVFTAVEAWMRVQQRLGDIASG